MGCAHPTAAAQSAVRDPESSAKAGSRGLSCPELTKSDHRFHMEYSLKDKLGEGTFAVVYAAAKVGGVEADVAVKIADLTSAERDGGKVKRASTASHAFNPLRLKDVRREVRVWKAVSGSQNVCQFLEGFIGGGCAFLVSEMCDKPLYHALEQTMALNEDSLRPFLQDMLTGLWYVHSLAVVHRDVKPANFMCRGAENTVKLCDFGSACIMSSRDVAECIGIRGTLAFTAPEMLQRLPYGTEVDVWSIGVTIYAICMGRFPYQPAANAASDIVANITLKAAIVSGSPAPTFSPAHSEGDEQLSRELVRLVSGLLCRSPSHRTRAGEALAQSFFSAAALPRECMRAALEAAKSCGAFGAARLGRMSLAEGSAAQQDNRPLPTAAGEKRISHLSDASTSSGGLSSLALSAALRADIARQDNRPLPTAVGEKRISHLSDASTASGGLSSPPSGAALRAEIARQDNRPLPTATVEKRSSHLSEASTASGGLSSPASSAALRAEFARQEAREQMPVQRLAL